MHIVRNGIAGFQVFPQVGVLGRIAHQAGAHRLILTHLSSRYDTDFGRLLAQAREEYTGPVEVAHDGMTVDLPVRE